MKMKTDILFESTSTKEVGINGLANSPFSR